MRGIVEHLLAPGRLVRRAPARALAGVVALEEGLQVAEVRQGAQVRQRRRRADGLDVVQLHVALVHLLEVPLVPVRHLPGDERPQLRRAAPQPGLRRAPLGLADHPERAPRRVPRQPEEVLLGRTDGTARADHPVRAERPPPAAEAERAPLAALAERGPAVAHAEQPPLPAGADGPPPVQAAPLPPPAARTEGAKGAKGAKGAILGEGRRVHSHA